MPLSKYTKLRLEENVLNVSGMFYEGVEKAEGLMRNLETYESSLILYLIDEKISQFKSYGAILKYNHIKNKMKDAKIDITRIHILRVLDGLVWLGFFDKHTYSKIGRYLTTQKKWKNFLKAYNIEIIDYSDCFSETSFKHDPQEIFQYHRPETIEPIFEY